MTLARGLLLLGVANVALLWVSDRWNSELPWAVGVTALFLLAVAWVLVCEELDDE